jgi:cytochrome c biogenesis protein CcdA
MPGGSGPRQDTVYGIWFSIVWTPSFGGIFLGAIFALRAEGPAWEVWAARAIVALFWWLVAFVSAAFNFRELRRRGEWLPPGATRRPWLTAAVYAAVMLLISTIIIAGFVVCLEFVFGGKT